MTPPCGSAMTELRTRWIGEDGESLSCAGTHGPGEPGAPGGFSEDEGLFEVVDAQVSHPTRGPAGGRLTDAGHSVSIHTGREVVPLGEPGGHGSGALEGPAEQRAVEFRRGARVRLHRVDPARCTGRVVVSPGHEFRSFSPTGEGPAVARVRGQHTSVAWLSRSSASPSGWKYSRIGPSAPIARSSTHLPSAA